MDAGSTPAASTKKNTDFIRINGRLATLAFLPFFFGRKIGVKDSFVIRLLEQITNEQIQAVERSRADRLPATMQYSIADKHQL